jgi:hypothetical protein
MSTWKARILKKCPSVGDYSQHYPQVILIRIPLLVYGTDRHEGMEQLLKPETFLLM